MKLSSLLPVLTAVIGFSIAWNIKQGDSPVPTKIEPAVATRPGRQDASNHTSPTSPKKGSLGKSHNYPLADLAALGPKTRQDAKMLRLTEALGLTVDQQNAIIKLIEDVQATTDASVPVIKDLTKRGKAVQEGLAQLLTPEQLAKFEELRIRERDNRIEIRSQQMLAQAMEDIDLSAQQRDEALNRLRQKSKAEMQSIPAAATILLDRSLLPTSGKELSVNGVLLHTQLGESLAYANPMDALQKNIDRQSQQLEEMLKCFDGILSPGQMGQYQAVLSEQREILRSLPSFTPPTEK